MSDLAVSPIPLVTSALNMVQVVRDLEAMSFTYHSSLGMEVLIRNRLCASKKCLLNHLCDDHLGTSHLSSGFLDLQSKDALG